MLTGRVVLFVLVFRVVFANILITNHGYCNLDIYRKTKKGRKRVGLILPRCTARFLELEGKTLQLGLKKENATEWILEHRVPDEPPGPYSDMVFARPYTYLSQMEPFHQLHVKASKPCAAPQFVPAADVFPACIILVLTGLVLVLSCFLSGATASGVERAGWILVLAIYYIVGFRSVYRTSNRYKQQTSDLKLDTNPKSGDKIWGLHGDYGSISWIFGGRRWDLKDIQYRELVGAFPQLFAFAVAYICIKLLGKWMTLHRTESTQRSVRLWLTLLSGLGMAIFLHEAKLLITFGIIILHYLLVTSLAHCGKILQDLIPVVSWAIGLSALVASAEGKLTLKDIMGVSAGKAGADLGAFLDGFKGELGWHAVFNFVVLHMISWAVDFYRSLKSLPARDEPTAAKQLDATGDREPSRIDEKAEVDDDASQAHHRSVAAEASSNVALDDERARVEQHRSLEEYRSLGLYLAYIFYPPLYITGPIITFNAFASYIQVPESDCVGWKLGRYALRCLLNLFLLVAFGHFLYTFAIMKNGPLKSFPENFATMFDLIFSWNQEGEALIWYSYWTLKGLWFKFLVVWRCARLWALADGICPPENMNRCMSNNYTVRGFWRAWHRSFNRWLVRYIFASIGGSRGVSFPRRLASIFVVFTFVAIWHEPQLVRFDRKMLHLLAWGWLMFGFMVPEVIAEQVCRLMPVRRFLDGHPLVARHLAAFGGSLCIEMLMVANLIGYTYGLEGAKELLNSCRQSSMIIFIAAYTAWLYAGAQMMMHIRQREATKLASKEF